ncbi:hypothetical protein CYMTET_37145 [Cymbomonas tetramitiformis]|uniref:Uncharacterized protein n=1 Tax=Cymbomonas tetramitiformis TaxID=36881 RepID=A0AAE0CEH0_9CHLO|nr:hypothetical protein CYMTET_37145 [Cymbomonas tetramitiformis]
MRTPRMKFRGARRVHYVRKASLRHRESQYANQKVGEENFRSFLRYQYPAITVSDRYCHSIRLSSLAPKWFGTPLASPKANDVLALAKVFKENSIQHESIVDALAVSDTLISKFVKEIKPTNALKGSRYLVRKVVQKGRVNKAPEFYDAFGASYAQWKGKKNFIFAAPSGNLADLVWPFFTDQATEFCAMFAPSSWADTCGESHRKLFLGSLMRARNDSCFFKLDRGENSWYISTASARKGINLFTLHGGYGLQPEFDQDTSDEYSGLLDAFVGNE